MAMNPESIRAKLLTVSREKKLVFQDLLDRYGAEQFLARLSLSPYVDQFIFKGGSLLTYLIETDRRTKDLDFSVLKLDRMMEGVLGVIQKILDVELDDGITWLAPKGMALDQPAMDYPGLRVTCSFRVGNAKGIVRMDLAAGDVVEPRKISLQRIRYRGRPLAGTDFPILAYPVETIFAEKLQIAVKRGAQNSRMKDFHDLYNLCRSKKLDLNMLKRSIEKTFKKRATPLISALDFDGEELTRLQLYWTAYVRKMKITDVPASLTEVTKAVNKVLGHVS